MTDTPKTQEPLRSRAAVAKMVTFVPSSVSGIASIVIGPHNEAIQGYELRPITTGDAFAEKAAKEIQKWLTTALRNARIEGMIEMAQKYVRENGAIHVPPDHILDSAGNVRRVLEWSHNPLTNRIHAELEHLTPEAA